MTPSYQSGFYAPGRGGTPKYPSLWRGCVGSWSPSLGQSGLVLRDWSGNKNHGTLTNMDAATDWVLSGGSTALDFDGTNDYCPLTSKNLLSLVGTSMFATVSFWVFPRSTSRNAYIADWSAAGSLETMRIEMSGFSMTAGRIGGTVLTLTDPIQTSSAPSLNQWHHIAIARNATGQQLWWNGREDAVTTTVFTDKPAASNPIVIGRAGSLSSLYANVIVGDVMLHTKVLSNREVRLLASRRGIAYESAPRKVYSLPVSASIYKPYLQNYRSQIIGGGLK